jgi:hypothetical protein
LLGNAGSSNIDTLRPRKDQQWLTAPSSSHRLIGGKILSVRTSNNTSQKIGCCFTDFTSGSYFQTVSLMVRHGRSISFSGIDEVESKGILSKVLIDNGVYLGGSAIGTGLNRATRYYLSERVSKASIPEHFQNIEKGVINDGVDLTPIEDSFFVVDLGIVVSQVYQWRKYFPRIEPFYGKTPSSFHSIVGGFALNVTDYAPSYHQLSSATPIP